MTLENEMPIDTRPCYDPDATADHIIEAMYAVCPMGQRTAAKVRSIIIAEITPAYDAARAVALAEEMGE